MTRRTARTERVARASARQSYAAGMDPRTRRLIIPAILGLLVVLVVLGALL